MPRITHNIVGPGEPNTYRNNMAWLKGGLSLMVYGGAIGGAVEKLKNECGTGVHVVSGPIKAPFDISGGSN